MSGVTYIIAESADLPPGGKERQGEGNRERERERERERVGGRRLFPLLASTMKKTRVSASAVIDIDSAASSSSGIRRG